MFEGEKEETTGRPLGTDLESEKCGGGRMQEEVCVCAEINYRFVDLMHIIFESDCIIIVDNLPSTINLKSKDLKFNEILRDKRPSAEQPAGGRLCGVIL